MGETTAVEVGVADLPCTSGLQGIEVANRVA